MKSLPEEMDDAIEALNLMIVKVEQKLLYLGLRVSAAVEIGNQQELLFSKGQSRGWTLTVISPSGGTTPLTDCSLEMRQRALSFVPKLYERMLFTCEQRISEMNLVVKQTGEFLDRIP